MQWKTHPVNIRVKGPDGKVTGTKEVGLAKFEQFDSLGEAAQELGDAKCLELINAQHRTNALNELRAAERPGGMTKTAMRNKAIGMFTQDDWAACAAAGPEAQKVMENKILAYVAEIEKSQPTKSDEDAGDE